MKKIILTLAIIASLSCSACSTRIAGMTVLSNRPIKTKNVEVSKLPQTKNVVGESKRFVFLFIPFGRPTIREALDDALMKADGDLMINPSLYSTFWWFIFGEVGYELHGNVVNTRKGK